MKKTEICLYCGDDYLPKRRGVQKFCSNSCRSLNWKNKQPIKKSKIAVTLPDNGKLEAMRSPTLPEKMSLAGIGNAAVGAAALEITKNILTPTTNKPATKKDIQDLKIFLKSRYLLVNNIARDIHGSAAYFDVQTANVVYLKI